jgi:MFS transporter, DHA1 family, solute carrier family 18 (vesicular amine transporter), member 1/2
MMCCLYIYHRTIGLGLLADVFPTNKLGAVMGTVMTAHTVGFAISPAAGGYLLEHGGFAAPFLFCAGLAVINFLVIVWLAEPKHNHIEETQDHVSRAQEDITEDESTPLVKNKNKKVQLTMIDLLKNWRIMSCVLCVTVSASVFSGIEPALPIHLRDTFDASASTIGCKYCSFPYIALTTNYPL